MLGACRYSKQEEVAWLVVDPTHGKLPYILDQLEDLKKGDLMTALIIQQPQCL